jgi:serine/threonine protein kinase
MKCPACGAANEDTAEVCFECREVMKAITRGTVLLDRYEILETLGRGGMGVVYKAKDRVLDEIVAVKTLHADVADDKELSWRFRSEIKLARKVAHKNVCRIYEYGEHEGIRFISMEYIPGTDLKRTIRERGPLPHAEAYDIAIQAARGVAAIHEVGIIHRDLKTLNIMIDGNGVVRLMDFGIAKSQDRDATSGTGTGQILGTPEYMSPEQARAQAIDARADVYALGIVIYEMFTGQVPFRGQTPVATLFMHVQDAPPLEGGAASRLPAALVPVLRKALAKDPADRYPNADALARALEAAREGRAEGDPPIELDRPTVATGLTPVAAPKKSGHGSLIVALVVLGAATLALFSGPLREMVGWGVRLPSPEPSASILLPDVETPVPSPSDTTLAPGGTLHLTVVPFAEVTVDGLALGAVDSKTIPLAVGRHHLVLVHPDFEAVQREVEVTPGGVLELTVDLTKEGTPK